MAEQTGIAGSQSRAQAAATTSRTKGRGIMRKYLIPTLIIATVVLPLLWWWRQSGTETVEKVTESLTTTKKEVQTPSILTGVVRWEKLEEDGSVPVGVWSQPSPTPSGCAGTHSYDVGKFRVERQNGTPKWIPFKAGDDSTATRYMATEKEALPPTFTWRC